MTTFSYAQAQQAIAALQGHAPATYQAAFNAYLAFVLSWARADARIGWACAAAAVLMLGAAVWVSIEGSDLDGALSFAFWFLGGAAAVAAVILLFNAGLSVANAHMIALNDLLHALIPGGGG